LILDIKKQYHTSSGARRALVRRNSVILNAVAFVALLLIHSPKAMASFVVPSDLNPGDHYRIIFVTSGIRDAASPNIAEYDGFVNGMATMSGSLLQSVINTSPGPTWLAIGSTEYVDASVHVGGDPDTPIYLPDGTLVASLTSLWSGSLQHAINQDQFGAVYGYRDVWTGTTVVTANPDLRGTCFMWDSYSFYACLGTPYGNPDGVRIGNTLFTDQKWATCDNYWNNALLPLYGISVELTVPDSVVPEPGSAELLIMALLALGTTRYLSTRQARRNVHGPLRPPRSIGIGRADQTRICRPHEGPGGAISPVQAVQHSFFQLRADHEL
jgi:hypothetical protein